MIRVKGFPPFCPDGSKALILGSFPSVKSRAQNFYYGNPQNRFWRVLAEFFGKTAPSSVEEKKNFLTDCKIALWDIVTECEIVGSQDSTIKNFITADVKYLLQNKSIGLIMVNGGVAYSIFTKHCGDTGVPSVKLPSTSPANTHFDKEEWFNALRRVFDRT